LSAILSFWRNASSKRKRLYFFTFVIVLSIAVTFAGTLVPLDDEMAKLLSDGLEQKLAENDDFASLTVAIFVNNVRLCLIMFIPFVGIFAGAFILFSTGVAVNALSIVQGVSPSFLLLALMIGPIFWIEFVAYSLGMTESVWLFRRLYKRRWGELKRAAILVGIAVGLLAIGALVEAWMILYLPAVAEETVLAVLASFSLP
jgi:hypothetical protein